MVFIKIGKWIRERFAKGGEESDPLSGVTIFEDLSKRERSKVAEAMRERSCSPDEPVFREGETDGTLYIVLEGGVEIRQGYEGDSFGARVHLGPGTFFGETALIEDAPRTATARSVGSSRLLCLSRSDFLTLCDHRPRLGIHVIVRLSLIVSERLRHTNRSLKEAESQKGREAEVGEARISSSTE